MPAITSTTMANDDMVPAVDELNPTQLVRKTTK